LFSFGDAINSVTWALVGDFFGRQHFASIRGWIGMIQSLASMPAAVCTGWIYDRTQSYTYALLPFIVIYVLAALVLCQASPPKTPKVVGDLRR
jgi:nitrate/nitrite transporter NarK